MNGILTVCTGNLCRSVYAAAALRARTGSSLPVRSAGTRPATGLTVPDELEAAARASGFTIDDHEPVPLTREAVASAALVLTAAREHRRAVAELSPRAARRAFTIRELARIAPVIDDTTLDGISQLPVDERFDVLVQRLAAFRGQAARPASPEDDDVVDPFGRDASTYAAMREQIEPGLTSLITLLGRITLL